MKRISGKVLKNGDTRLTLDLKPGEFVVALKEDSHYKLGGQVDDIVATHVIAEAMNVCWCSISQQWEQS